MKRSLLALIAALLASPAFADTLVDNANGIQTDASGQLQRFTGLVIGDDGKVVRVLGAPDARPANITARIDAGGRTLLPGLIDAHGHVMGLGQIALSLNLTGTSSLADLQQRLKAYADSSPGDGWIVGAGWNQELWPDKSFPTTADLDSIVADRPVWLTRVDGHAAVANSAALKAAGVDAATQAPAGGSIDGGLLVDNAMALVESKIPLPTDSNRDRWLAEAQRQMLSVGLTAVADMGTSSADWATLRRAGQAGRLNVRVLSYAAGVEAWRSLGNGKPTDWSYGDRLRLIGTKLSLDGALGSRGAWLKQPYSDKPDTNGLRLLTEAELINHSGEVAAGGGQLAIHAIGDAANARVIGLFEQLHATYPADRRWRIEHLQVADPADLPRLKPAGIIASMQPVHQTSDRTMAEVRLGPDRLGGAYAWQSIAKLGVPLAFGSDFPVESPNPFPGLAAAVSRQDMNGQPPGGWRPHERLSFAQALHGFTRGAAHASFAEGRIGALDPGKWADFILIDRDPTAIDPQSLARTQVLETWVAGKKVWSFETPLRRRSAAPQEERGN